MKKILLLMILAVVFILGACKGGGHNTLDEKEEAVPTSSKSPINIPLINRKGEKTGEAELVETDKGVAIRVMAQGLEPGKKAIHIHETGKCVPPDFKSAGAHFNPFNKEHGFHNPKGYHAGDLVNIEVPVNGKVDVVLKSADVTLKTGQPNSILDGDGSALVIHEKADDYKTDPAGNAGNRIICGEIVREGN
ncbi:superoxide dismutase family protein [Siminovitchia sp. 179-K 8D1 HS]|uniref:superoxide dismutase family protein n=1 Tax=Siminovitchia sp. 179-K 8D1 HS TaxID=3142385 RepID=UPI0039A26B9B